MENFKMPFSSLITILLYLTTHQVVSTDSASSSCVEISAALTAVDYGHYLFSGNKFTYYSPILPASMRGKGDNEANTARPITDFTGIDNPDVEITAAYVEPETNQIARLFSGNDVYRVDLTKNKVLGKMPMSQMFSKSEMSKLQKGVQAAATSGLDVYFFSGCNVLKTDFHGDTKDFNLESLKIPCDVDSALAYPMKDANHLLITKGSKAYGWFLTSSSSPSFGYYMFCVAKVLRNSALDLCHCDR